MNKVLLLSAHADAARRIAADGWEVRQVHPAEVDVPSAAAGHRVAIADIASAPDALDVAIALRAANGSLEFVVLAGDERGAVDAVRRGAFDAIPWPDDPLEARLMIESALRKTAPPSPVTDRIGEYTFRKRLAIGGMAEVFLADTPGRAGFVVVKCLLSSLAKDPEFLEMFVTEARTSAQLVHPNIVRVVDFGTEGDRIFLALEFVDGWDLDRAGVAVRWRFPPAIACHVVAEVCRGLGYAHARTGVHGEPLNLVHRDVNPPNVLVSRAGDIRLSDFGIAKSAYSTVQTQHGIIKGKVDWFSPEQITGVPLDGRSDVFSAGTILHLLLTGTHPFRALTRVDTMNRIRSAEYVPPSELRAGLPHQLDAIVARALARDPEQRYRRADDLESALRSVIDSLGGMTHEEVAAFFLDAMGDPADLRATEATVLSRLPPPGDVTILRAGSVTPRNPPQHVPTITPIIDRKAEKIAARQDETILRPAPARPRWIGVAAALFALAGLGAAAMLAGEKTADPTPTPFVRTPAPTPRETVEIVRTPTPRPTTEIARVTITPRPIRNGTLSIWIADGWAAISVDGKSLGLNAPRVGIPIAEGRHRVTLENPALGFRREYDVTISAGKESKLQVQLR